jgi:hypothetical protein
VARNSREDLQNYALKSMDDVHVKLDEAALYSAKSRDRQINHILPLHPQFILIWKRYQLSRSSWSDCCGKRRSVRG